MSDAAIDFAACAFLMAWPPDSEPPPWPMDYRDAGLRAFVRRIVEAYEKEQFGLPHGHPAHG